MLDIPTSAQSLSVFAPYRLIRISIVLEFWSSYCPWGESHSPWHALLEAPPLFIFSFSFSFSALVVRTIKVMNDDKSTISIRIGAKLGVKQI